MNKREAQVEEFIKRCNEFRQEISDKSAWNDQLYDGSYEDAYIDAHSAEWRVLYNQVNRFLRKNAADLDGYMEKFADIFYGKNQNRVYSDQLDDMLVLFHDMKEELKEINDENGEKSCSKERKVFISHSSKDVDYVKEFVELLQYIGLREEEIVCTSYVVTGVPLGKKIYAWLIDTFRSYDLHIIYMLSQNYYESPASLNEMGAAWAFRNNWDGILLPGFDFSDIKGCIDKDQICIKLDDNEAKHRLGELKDKLVKEFSLREPSSSGWEIHRDSFLEKIKKICGESSHKTVAYDVTNNGIIDNVYQKANAQSANLSNAAALLLAYASKDYNGEIIVLPMLGGKHIQTGNWDFVGGKGAREEARWLSAIDELLFVGLIRLASTKDKIYRLTDKGYTIGEAYLKDNEINVNNPPGEYMI